MHSSKFGLVHLSLDQYNSHFLPFPSFTLYRLYYNFRCDYTQWRIQKFWKGGRKTIYKPRPHLSQMHATVYRPFTRKKAAFGEKIEPIGGGGAPPPPPWIRHWYISCIARGHFSALEFKSAYLFCIYLSISLSITLRKPRLLCYSLYARRQHIGLHRAVRNVHKTRQWNINQSINIFPCA